MGGLAPGYSTGRVVQPDEQLAVLHPGGTGVHLTVGAELDQTIEGLCGRGAAGPDRASGGDLGDV